MPVCLFIWGILSFRFVVLAQDDLEAAAITVYRNPEFFRHLSEEFNDYVKDFGAEKPLFGPDDKSVSPFLPEPYKNYGDADEGPQNAGIDDTSYQQEAPEEEAEEEQNYREENNGGESEGGGFNTYNPSDHENENLKSPDEDEPLRDDVHYKYPGEPKKPNVPESPKGGGHFAPSPDFNHPPRRLPPKKPKKKGRGPYGHPKFLVDEEQADGKREIPRYSDDFEEGKTKSEEQQLIDVENESRRYKNPEETYEDIPRNLQELKIYHNGQRYPINVEGYTDSREPLQEEFPLGHYDHYHPYPPTGEESYLPTAQSIHFTKDAEEFKQQKSQNYPVDFRDIKKGTREYLKFHKYPANHELHDLNEVKVGQELKKPEMLGSNSAIRQKRPRKFVVYRVRPVYAHYKVVPVYHTSAKRQPTFLYKRAVKGSPSPRVLSKIRSRPKLVADDSAYVINSELDQDYQNLKIIKKKF